MSGCSPGIRLANGLPIDDPGAQARLRVGELIGDGLVDGQLALTDRRLVLTRRGRLPSRTLSSTPCWTPD